MTQTWIQDCRYALQALVRRPQLSLGIVLVLALGMGANITVYSVVDAVLLRPLPFADHGQLVLIERHDQRRNEFSTVISYPDLLDWQKAATTIEAFAGYRGGGLLDEGGEVPIMLGGWRVTPNFFSVLGVKPAMGRGFLPGEESPDAPAVIILSHGLWQSRYGADPEIVGKTTTLSETPYTIVGVLPPEARFPLPQLSTPELLTPLQPRDWQMDRGNKWIQVVGRLSPQTTLQQAQAEMDSIAAGLAERYPESNAERGVRLSSLTDHIVGPMRPGLLTLLGAVAAVLLIACANVANLLLVRGVTRRRELAVRQVVGAGRVRLVRQLMAESLFLSLVSGGLAFVLVWWILEGMVLLLPEGMPRIEFVGIDGRIVLFALGLVLFTTVAFGLIPALQSSRLDLFSSLKEGASSENVSESRLRGLLVVAELALAVVLLAGAGLLLRSFVHLIRVDPGFSPDGVATLQFSRLNRGQELADIAFLEQLLERVRQVSGVQEAGIVDCLPIAGCSGWSRLLRGKFSQEGIADPDKELQIEQRSADANYFKAVGISLLEGRLFDVSDAAGAPKVLLISRSLASSLWPQQTAVGHKTVMGEVIGVVEDIRHYGLQHEPSFMVYSHFRQKKPGMYALVARVKGDAAKMLATLRAQMLDLDPHLVITSAAPMEQIVSQSVAQPRFFSLLVASFAWLALVLSAVGVYGTVSYNVTRRFREVGIRMALGASRTDILSLVVRRGALLCTAGVLLGLVAALALTRLLESLLFEISPNDPATFAIVVSLLALLSLAACYLPARRAARTDPVQALRME